MGIGLTFAAGVRGVHHLGLAAFRWKFLGRFTHRVIFARVSQECTSPVKLPYPNKKAAHAGKWNPMQALPSVFRSWLQA
jgi:hypothetical protein